MKKSKKAKAQFLKRPIRVMLRFDKREMREVDERVKRSRLSRAEYGRRKMLDIPIADTEQQPAPPAETAIAG